MKPGQQSIREAIEFLECEIQRRQRVVDDLKWLESELCSQTALSHYVEAGRAENGDEGDHLKFQLQPKAPGMAARVVMPNLAPSEATLLEQLNGGLAPKFRIHLERLKLVGEMPEPFNMVAMRAKGLTTRQAGNCLSYFKSKRWIRMEGRGVASVYYRTELFPKFDEKPDPAIAAAV